MCTTKVLRTLMIAAATCMIATVAPATPVVIGSTYSLFLTSGNGRNIGVSELTFDGLAETFTRTVDLGSGLTQDVTFSVSESQFGVAGSDGTHRVSIIVESDADLLPSPNRSLVGFSFGSFDDNPLDLDGLFRLDINRVSLRSGVEVVASDDWANASLPGRQTDPWDGYFLTSDHFGAFINDPNLSGRSINRVEFTMQLQQVPEPGALSLAAAALVLLCWQQRGAAAGVRGGAASRLHSRARG